MLKKSSGSVNPMAQLLIANRVNNLDIMLILSLTKLNIFQEDRLINVVQIRREFGSKVLLFHHQLVLVILFFAQQF